MRNLMVFLATTEPSPGGDLREGLDPEAVTPGTLGFLATLFVVVITFFLIRDMTKRVRRVRYREQVQEEAARAEAAAAEDNDGGTAAGGPAADDSDADDSAADGRHEHDGPESNRRN
ncbi:hypothetical protein [Arthrobacter monumenti]